MDKKKKRTLVQLVLAFVLGGVLMSTISVKICDKMFCDDNFLARPSLRILDSICLLKQLRKKKLDKAIYLTEWQLDQDIIELSFYVSPENKDELQLIVQNSIKQAQKYRAKHPTLVKAPDLVDAVDNVLNLDYSKSIPAKNTHFCSAKQN